MRYSRVKLLLIALLLTGCKFGQKDSQVRVSSPSRSMVTVIKPASIAIDASTGWSAAPTDGGMPVFTDQDNRIRFFPPALRGTLIIQRRGGADGDHGYLGGKVSVPTDAILYAAFACQVNERRLISDEQFDALGREGWSRVPGIFQITEPITQETLFQVWAHSVPAGAVTLSSEAVPEPGVLFLGRQH